MYLRLTHTLCQMRPQLPIDTVMTAQITSSTYTMLYMFRAKNVLLPNVANVSNVQSLDSMPFSFA